jgi:hypothetical protein
MMPFSLRWSAAIFTGMAVLPAFYSFPYCISVTAAKAIRVLHPDLWGVYEYRIDTE